MNNFEQLPSERYSSAGPGVVVAFGSGLVVGDFTLCIGDGRVLVVVQGECAKAPQG